jgi:hypothetical protein
MRTPPSPYSNHTTLIAAKHPTFTTLHVAALDQTQHERGPGSAAAKSVLQGLHGRLGRLLAARRAQPDLVVALDMRDIAPTLAKIMHVGLPSTDGKKLF